MSSKFDQLILDIPKQERCYQSGIGKFCNYELNYCFFGVSSNKLYGLLSFDDMPQNPPGVAFLGSPSQNNLVKAFCCSNYSKTVKEIAIGTSSDIDDEVLDDSNLQYQNRVASLSTGNFPNLKVIRLGIWWLFENSHCMYGWLGDITNTLKNLSYVEEIHLYGNFQLTEPITLEAKVINIVSDDLTTEFNGGSITNKTFNNLLSSEMPNIEFLSFDLLCANDREKRNYIFPKTFLDGSNTPNLKDFIIEREAFDEKEWEKLLKSQIKDTV